MHPPAADLSNAKEFMNVTVTINGLVTPPPIDFPLDISWAFGGPNAVTNPRARLWAR
jgi:hypothetical protein